MQERPGLSVGAFWGGRYVSSASARSHDLASQGAGASTPASARSIAMDRTPESKVMLEA